MNLHVVRHGESESNAGLSEDIDSELTSLGLRQAEHTAALLAQDEISAILCSPFRRTIDTAMSLCARTGVGAELFPHACEWFNGEWPLLKPFHGRRLADIADGYPSVIAPSDGDGATWWPNWPERQEQFHERCTRAVEQIRKRFEQLDTNVVVYGHAASCLGILAAVLGPSYWSDAMDYENAALTTVRITADGTEVVRFKDVPDVQ